MICCFFLSLYLHIHAVREKITERNDDEEEMRKALARVSERERGKKELKFYQKFILNQIFFNTEKKTKKWCETQQQQQQTLRALSSSLQEQKINLFLHFSGLSLSLLLLCIAGSGLIRVILFLACLSLCHIGQGRLNCWIERQNRDFFLFFHWKDLLAIFDLKRTTTNEIRFKQKWTEKYRNCFRKKTKKKELSFKSKDEPDDFELLETLKPIQKKKVFPKKSD